jgi:hypothetical protein
MERDLLQRPSSPSVQLEKARFLRPGFRQHRQLWQKGLQKQ